MTVVLLLIGLAQLLVQVLMLLMVFDEPLDGRIEEIRDIERRTIERLYEAAADE